MKKKIFLLLLIMIMICPSFAKALKVKNYTANTDGQPGESGACNNDFLYCWNDFGNRSFMHASIRITVVDKDGDRLKLTVGGKDYTSTSLDYYDYRNLGVTNRRHNEIFYNKKEPMYYMTCGTVKQGDEKVEKLCMRKDYENVSGTNFRKRTDKTRDYKRISSKGNQKDSHYYKKLEVDWNFENLQLPYGFNTENGQYQGTKMSEIISELYKQSNYPIVEKIFEDLMGIKISDVTADQSSACGENKRKLEGAFIIFEPVSLVGGKVTGLDSPTNPVPQDKIGFYGSATEYALFMYDDKTNDIAKLAPEALPSVYGAISLNGNDGKNFGVESGDKKCTDKNKQGCYGFYYQNINTDGKDTSEYLKNNNFKINNTVYQTKKGKNNINKGFGIGALYLKDASPNINLKCYDYSVDVACTNCDSNNEDNAAYIIQDTTNWNAIESAGSDSSTENDVQKCVKKHFVRQNGKVKCREEYT